MITLLRVDVSPGGDHSVSKQLGDYFERHWLSGQLDRQVVCADLASSPPPLMTEKFIQAAFTPPEEIDANGRAALTYSDHALTQIADAHLLLITTPMYNFGLPAALKAWFDQIIRIGVTFGTTNDPTNPYLPLLPRRPVVVITARGNAQIVTGGALQQFDFLTPHLRTLLTFIGFSDPSFFDMCGTEEPPEVWEEDLKTLQCALERKAAELESEISSCQQPEPIMSRASLVP
jgi:FMN-dependent NADH-azoreductase